MSIPSEIVVSWPVVVAVCFGTSAAVVANVISFVMIGKVNERLPLSDRISYLGWGTGVRRRFKQLYPGNWLLWALRFCAFMMFTCFVALIKFWVFG
jgi:hypothetical protein